MCRQKRRVWFYRCVKRFVERPIFRALFYCPFLGKFFVVFLVGRCRDFVFRGVNFKRRFGRAERFLGTLAVGERLVLSGVRVVLGGFGCGIFACGFVSCVGSVYKCTI